MRPIGPIGKSVRLLLAGVLAGCSYNALVGSEEEVNGAWGQVENY